jgi:16S rRNA (cytosine1402-N4)-methyltransferase
VRREALDSIEHKPVLLNEVVEALKIQPGGCYVDGTVGGGGHAEAILEKMEGRGTYVAIDRDIETLERAKKRLQKFKSQVVFVHGVYSEIKTILEDLKIDAVDGVLLDLGVSSFQFDEAERGFSFSKEAPLDMRMDRSSEGETAADLINQLREEKLIEIFQKFGEERFARRIARAIVAFRRAHPLLKTGELAGLIERVVPPHFKRRAAKIHPATRVFQALRIVVNEELEHLTRFLDQDFKFLKPGGRIAVISFHSLEDRLVKWAFRSRQDLRVVTKRPLGASEEELKNNPRARSAKLRVAEKQ